MDSVTYIDYLIQLSQRLSRNMPFADGEDAYLSDDALFNRHYNNFAETQLKSFDEANKNPFFKLLINSLQEAFNQLPGWTGWLLLEYYDEATNGLNLVLIADKSEDFNTFNISELDQNHYNFSTLIRAIRQLHVHMYSWHFGEAKRSSDIKYIPLNKLAIAKLLPGEQNPYDNKEKSEYYKATIKPIIISEQEPDENKIFCRVKKSPDGYTFEDDLGYYLSLLKKLNENAKAYEKKLNGSSGNQLIDMIGDEKFDDLSKITGKTESKLLEDIGEKLERSINYLEITKGKKIQLSEKAFASYCDQLTSLDSSTKSFVYFPVYTNIKKGRQTPQRKDLQLGSVTIGSTDENAFSEENVKALWRFVQVEMLKWYAQFSSFDLYNTNRKLENEARLNALTQVFARNESHINGSHVIPHLLKKVTTFEDKYKSIYFEYLKGRMELVGSVQNFPGLVKTITNLDTLIKSFKENKILWEGIIEGKCEFNRTFIIYDKDKLDFQLPGAALGEQVFCSLLEGIIRNFVKHNISDTAFELKITLKIELPSDDHFIDDYLSLSVYGNVVGNQKTVKKINDAIQEKVLDETKLRGHNLGMLELKAASLLLMDAPLEAIDLFQPDKAVNVNGKSYPGCLKADLFKEGENKFIGYRLYLLIPKLVYTLTDNYEKIKNSLNGISPKHIVQTKEFDPGIACTFYIGENEVGSSNFRQIKKNDDGCTDLTALWKIWVQQVFPDTEEAQLILLENGDNLCGGTHQVVVDDHGDWRNKHPDFDLTKLLFYGAFNSEHKAGIIKKKPIEGTNVFTIDRWSFIEASLTKVAILDERIQHWASGVKHQNTKMPMIEAYKHMRVYMPEIKEMDLNIPQGNRLVEVIKSYFDDGCRYVVLHHSIFERLCFDLKGSKEATTIDSFYHELHQPANGRFLVLVSGLGIPTNLPKQSFYCSLSSLENVVKDRPNKYFLVQFLFALRTT
jgi:hypothetical protein